MEVPFFDADLDRLETNPSFEMKLPAALVKAYRRRLQGIRAAVDERDLRVMKSWHFEKLRGKREGQYSIRLNDQFRLTFELAGESPSKQVRIVAIEDYH